VGPINIFFKALLANVYFKRATFDAISLRFNSLLLIILHLSGSALVQFQSDSLCRLSSVIGLRLRCINNIPYRTFSSKEKNMFMNPNQDRRTGHESFETST